MTKFSPAAAEAWDRATAPRSCATCIHSSVARSALPCEQCYGMALHEERHIIHRGERAHGGLNVRNQGDPA